MNLRCDGARASVKWLENALQLGTGDPHTMVGNAYLDLLTVTCGLVQFSTNAYPAAVSTILRRVVNQVLEAAEKRLLISEDAR
jgi:hypothetical protein